MWTAKTHCKLAELILKVGQRFFSKSVLILVCWTDNRKTELSLDPCSFSVCWNEFGTKSRFSTWACPSLAVSGPGWGHLFNTAFQNDCWRFSSDYNTFFSAGEEHEAILINRLYLCIGTLAKTNFLIKINFLSETYSLPCYSSVFVDWKYRRNRFLLSLCMAEIAQRELLDVHLLKCDPSFQCGHCNLATCSIYVLIFLRPWGWVLHGL